MSETSTQAHGKSHTAASRQPEPQRRGPAVESMPALSPVAALQSRAGNRAASLWLSGGMPLSEDIRQEMESRFGESFEAVRIHNQPQAHASAAAMHAKAYTHGSDIVFSANRFAPQTASGKRLLAHELAHVVQQRRGGAQPGLDANAAHEDFARQAADGVAADATSVSVRGSTGVGIAREPEDEDKKKAKGGKPPKSGKSDDPTRARGKEILEEFEERAHDPDQKTELGDEKLRKRSGASERARHADRLKDIDEHHGLPKFLGGNKVQTYIKLTKELHYLYHEELYVLLEKEFKQRKVLDPDAKRNARRSYGRLFNKLDTKAQEEVLARIVAHTEEFDKRYANTEYPDKRQRLAAAVKRGIKEAKAEAKAAKSVKPASPAKGAKRGKPGSGPKSNKGAKTPKAAKPSASVKPAAPAKPPAATNSAKPAKPAKATKATPTKAATKPKPPKAPKAAKPAAPTGTISNASPATVKPAVKGTSSKPATPTIDAPAPKAATPAIDAPAPKAATPSIDAPAPKASVPHVSPTTPDVHATAPKVNTSSVHAPTAPKVGGRMKAVAGHGAGVLFAMAMSYLASKVQGDVEQERADALAKQEAPGLQKQLQQKLDEQSDRILTLQAQNPFATVYANITYDAETWETYLVAGDDVITGTDYEGTTVAKVEVGYLPLPQHWRTSDGSAARGGSEDHEFTTTPEALELQPFETLIAHAKANAIPLAPLRAYCRAKIAEAGQQSDSGLGPRMDAYWRGMLAKVDE